MAMDVVAGEETGFRELVEAHQASLHAYCWRILGSTHDADDAVQETLLRAWRGLPQFRGQSSLKTWLNRIATNVCLDAIARRRKHALLDNPGHRLDTPVTEERRFHALSNELHAVADGAPSPEERYERRDELERALLATLTYLPQMQRAAFVLHDVVGLSAKEAAESLHTTVAAINSALGRARTTVHRGVGEGVTLRVLRNRHLRQVVERFADFCELGDVDAILTILTDNVPFASGVRADVPQRQVSVAAA
jgi:RNA polymerase sigma-70 factor, ECF subfamily